MGNSILNKAKYTGNTDEWYTDYNTIDKEVHYYTEQLRNKRILCNCDNPYKSAFVKYFLVNFNTLGLKSLTCLSYNDDSINRGLRLHVKEVSNELIDALLNSDNIQDVLDEYQLVTLLHSDGDFLGEESLSYMAKCDVVITNPPFSKFREIFTVINQCKKKYLLISNQNAITYKEVFPYIKKDLARVGYNFGDMSFKVPKSTEPRKTRFWIDDNGQKWRSLGNAMWLTNLAVNRSVKPLLLLNSYKKEYYPRYDDFDAIHIAKVAEIPHDYNGIMGVPLTYLKYHDPDKYKIVGEANHGSDNEYDFFKPKINGKEIFKRLLIQKKRAMTIYGV